MNIRRRSVFLSSLFILSCALFAPRDAAAQQVKWQPDFARAARLAQRMNKPLLVEVGAEWCGYCAKMQQETLRNVHVADHINACFVPVKVDADAEKKLVAALVCARCRPR